MAKKPFFFRLEPLQLMTALIQIPESGRGAWITQVSIELATGNPESEFVKALYAEAEKFQAEASERSRQAGLVSAERRKQKATDVEQTLTDVEQTFNPTQPSSSKQLAVNSKQLIEAKEEKKKPLSEYSDEFLRFWAAYPKKNGKGAAWNEWKRYKPPIDKVLAAIKWQINSQKWRDGYILDPERYIKKRSWEDEPPKSEPSKMSGLPGVNNLLDKIKRMQEDKANAQT